MTDVYMHYEVDDYHILTATMDDPNGRVNVMNGAFLDALHSFVSKLENERQRYRGVILTSGKSTFFAGGDLEEIIAVTPQNRDAYFNKVESIKMNFRRLERAGLPIVAAINGAALGGGYEICLTCHYRIALDTPKTVVGLPEVTLGLLPGGGGVIRLTRQLGLDAALEFLLSGRAILPQDALNYKLIDAVAQTPDNMMALAKDWILANPSPVQVWDSPKFQFESQQTAQKHHLIEAEFEARIQSGEFVLGPAPSTILTCALECSLLNFDLASPVETHYLAELAISPDAKSKINAFFEKTAQKRSRAPS